MDLANLDPATGYLALFALSFTAATLLPLGSEWLLAALLLKGGDPFLLVFIATLGNLLGAVTTWLVGRYGGDFLIRRCLRIDAAAQRRAEERYGRYGIWSLLFSWVPLIGDPLCLIAGIFRVRLTLFIPLVGAGKLGRYLLLAWAVVAGMG
jgi:membrane protein YqaA with SNARE-associated domain